MTPDEARRDEQDVSQVVSARMRRTPKYGAFLALGGAAGIVVSMILAFSFNGTAQPSAEGIIYSPVQVFGFILLVLIPVGVLLGGLVAIILDRAMARRSREVEVGHERIHVVDGD